MLDEVPNESELKAGVRVEPCLDWHKRGCVKRYGAEAQEPCQCEIERSAVRVTVTPAMAEHHESTAVSTQGK